MVLTRCSPSLRVSLKGLTGNGTRQTETDGRRSSTTEIKKKTDHKVPSTVFWNLMETLDCLRFFKGNLYLKVKKSNYLGIRKRKVIRKKKERGRSVHGRLIDYMFNLDQYHFDSLCLPKTTGCSLKSSTIMTIKFFKHKDNGRKAY